MATTTHAEKSDAARAHVSDAIVIGALSCLWIGAILVIGARGNFPINDDWAYATMVRRFLQSGEFQPTSWTFTPTITNTLIGAAAATIFGFSHEVLRSTNLFMGWLGMMGAYVLLRNTHRSPRVSAIAAICYGFNPVHLALSYTFMTDIAFAALFTWTLAFAAMGANGHKKMFLVALGVSLAAILSRQPGAVLPAAMLGAGLVKAARDRKRLVKGALVLTAVSIVVIVVYDVIAVQDLRVSFLVGLFLEDRYVLYHLAANVLSLGTALGLLCVPITVIVAPILEKRDLFRWLAVIFLAGALLLLLFDTGRLIPSTREGMLNSAGIGNFGLHGYGLRPHLPTFERWLVSLVAALSASWIFVNVVRQFSPSRVTTSRQDYVFILCLLTTILYLVPVSLKGNGFDRYVLPLVAPVIVLTLQGFSGVVQFTAPRVFVAGGLSAAFLIIGTLGTRDYLGHLRVRNELIDIAKKKYHAEASEIQGGFEYDGYVRYGMIDPSVAKEVAEDPPTGSYDMKRLLLRRRSDTLRFSPPGSYPLCDSYLLSLSPHVSNFEMLESRTLIRLLTFSPETVYLYRRVRAEPNCEKTLSTERDS